MPPRSNDTRTPLLKDMQRQADEVVDVTRQNLEKVLERDHHISDLSDKADQLKFSSRGFKQTSTKLRWKFLWDNLWVRFCCIFWVLAVIGVVVYFVVTSKK